MTDVSGHSLLERGRDALERHDWADAYDALSQADREGSLAGEGLHLLAEAAYWAARPDETVEALERAFGAYLSEGDRAAAAMMAFRVAEQHGMRMLLSQAQGWAARAGRLAAENPEWPVHGWLVWMQGLLSWFQGDFEAAVSHYEKALEIAFRTGDRDLQGMSLHDKGHALCLLGRVGEGKGLLDEAMAAVVGGELGPDAAGYVYCGMIGICSKLGDYRRAAEWTESTLRWCDRESVPAFPGVCRIHKAELLRLAGSLTLAEEEARMACEELPRFNFFSGLGPANYEIGEVRRRLGDFRGAGEAFARAQEFGFNPEPGLSLLRLAQGKLEVAGSGIREALAEVSENHCLRIRLLAAQTEIAIVAGDLEVAGSAADELGSLVGEFEAASLHAIAQSARGAVLLARGDPAGALPDLRRARKLWQEIEAPYEVAELRLLMARAHHRSGDDEAAVMEARSSRDMLERLGARPAAETAGAFLSELTAGGESPERVRRAFMFTDIVKSTDLVSLIGDEAWEDLLAWHDQALRSLFATHGGEVAHHTGDGFFVAFDGARAALTCAVAVQRALAEHRRAHGFAPQVRMGVHAAEATRRGQDFSGVEVHKAARVASLAAGGEILVTADTLADMDASTLAVSDVRTVSVKGIAAPFEIMALEWRTGGPPQSGQE
ncbi:MAG TPA: adenylate/guanylate cyclase domain-containing protein [Actinomycetota bacterium]|nr:adenylate/guanylate cyclase domain-containing protein [Actinomycetota bacterium]